MTWHQSSCGVHSTVSVSSSSAAGASLAAADSLAAGADSSAGSDAVGDSPVPLVQAASNRVNDISEPIARDRRDMDVPLLNM